MAKDMLGQMKRAGLSVANNLAEGAARKSKAEKNRFFEVSRSSVVEIDNCLVVCTVLNYVTKEDIEEIVIKLIELFKLISGLIDSNNR